jgi:hypothetical protein
MLFIFMHFNVDGIATITAILNIVLILTTRVDGDVGGMATKRADDCLMQ